MSFNQDSQPRGYWLIQPPDLDEFMSFVVLPDFQICGISCMAWLAGAISINLDFASKPYSLHAIWVEQFGKYPSLAVQLERADAIVPDDLDIVIGKEAVRILREKPVIELLQFILTHQTQIENLRKQRE